jgi:hypothetical protein
MFCPQCRAKWPADGNSGELKADKPKRNAGNGSEWGRSLLCPSCQVPLAADRIQGEFPSVAHASSSKEGSMTIKDVLRETESSGSSAGDVPLDDKAPEEKKRLFGLSRANKSRLSEMFTSPVSGARAIVQRLAIITFAACVASIVFFSLRAVMQAGKAHHASVVQVTPGAHPALPVAEQNLLAVMPQKLGDWVREESNADVWKNDNSGDTDFVYSSTYRLGNDRVIETAVKATPSDANSELTEYYGCPRIVHTDTGIFIAPTVLLTVGQTHFIRFDYAPKDSSMQFWIAQDQSFSPTQAHTISWYQAPYIITVSSRTAQSRDRYMSEVLGLYN